MLPTNPSEGIPEVLQYTVHYKFGKIMPVNFSFIMEIWAKPDRKISRYTQPS